MLLVAVDIGNTNVVIGFLDDGHIAGTYRITTKANHTSDEYGLMITQFLRLSGYAPGDVDDVIITSVVPKVISRWSGCLVCQRLLRSPKEKQHLRVAHKQRALAPFLPLCKHSLIVLKAYRSLLYL